MPKALRKNAGQSDYGMIYQPQPHPQPQPLVAAAYGEQVM